jgi:hypothetical protein
MFDLLERYGTAGTFRPHIRLPAEGAAGSRRDAGNALPAARKAYLLGTSLKLAQPFGSAPIGPQEASAAGERSRSLKF